jgi:hypothetical protein
MVIPFPFLVALWSLRQDAGQTGAPLDRRRIYRIEPRLTEGLDQILGR